MPKLIQPVTIYTRDAAQAILLTRTDLDGRAITGGPGTLSFHKLIAEHGAGVFERLYCPVDLKDKWKPPAGGKILYADGAR